MKRLVPVWNLSLDNNWGEQAQPIIYYNGVMYVTNARHTVAIDVAAASRSGSTRSTGRRRPRASSAAACPTRARDLHGKIFRTTLDAHLLALDAKTGKEIWKSKVAEWKDGFSLTLAPLIANGVVVIGNSGAEFGVRGWIDGWDPETGKQLWRRTPFRHAARRATRPGRRTTMPGSWAAVRPGSPAPTIPSST